MTHTTSTAKSTSIFLSHQVREILTEKGYSFLFNWSDYQYYKSKAKYAFNKAQEIADLFISETQAESDFNGYIF